MFYELFRHISTMTKITQTKTPIIQYPVNNNTQLDFRKELQLMPITNYSSNASGVPLFQRPQIMVKYNSDNRHIISFIMGIGVGLGVGFGIGIGLVRYGGKPIYKW